MKFKIIENQFCLILFFIFLISYFSLEINGDIVDAKNKDFICPKGKILKPKKNYVPSSNGCGTAGIQVQTDDDFTKCCNVHDM